MSPTPSIATHEEGVTLVELLVYVSLSILVMIVAISTITNVLRVQSRVRNVSTATSSGQAIARSVQRGISNSSSFTAGPASAAGQLLQARVASTAAAGAVTWRCQAWFFSATNSAFYVYSSPTIAAGAAPTLSGSGSPTSNGWSLLASGVLLPSNTSQPFTAADPQLTLRLAVSASGASGPVAVSTTAVRPPQSDTTTTPTCL